MSTTFSTILEMKHRFEMGGSFSEFQDPVRSFLISGVSIAFLKLSGNVAVDKDKLTKSVICKSIIYLLEVIHLQFEKNV